MNVKLEDVESFLETASLEEVDYIRRLAVSKVMVKRLEIVKAEVFDPEERGWIDLEPEQ